MLVILKISISILQYFQYRLDIVLKLKSWYQIITSCHILYVVGCIGYLSF